jgi:hypothetical protein
MSMAAEYRSAAGAPHEGARMSNLSVNISARPRRRQNADRSSPLQTNLKFVL